MTEYPEALLETVARGIFTGILAGGDDAEWERELASESSSSWKRYLFCVAQDALDALGLQEEFGWETTNEQLGVTYKRMVGAGTPSHRRLMFRSDWEDA
jgi:hypothetical protein